MKRSNIFMIKCFLEKASEDHIRKLLETLTTFIEDIFEDAKVSLRSDEYYWKYPEDKQLIFEIKSQKALNVAYFIGNTMLSWEYKSEIARDADTDKLYFSEEALWRRESDSQERFLLPEIYWIRVYTWPVDEVEDE